MTDLAVTEQAPEKVVDWRGRVRTGAAWALTILAFSLVWFALVAPDQRYRMTPAAFLRIPVEGLVLVAICVYIPARARKIVAIVVGVLLGVLTLVKLLDIGFYVALDRPFSPVTDWGNFKPAIGVLRDSIGKNKTIAAEVIVTLLVVMAAAVGFALAHLGLLTNRLENPTSKLFYQIS